MSTKRLIIDRGMILCHVAGQPAKIGERLTDFRGDVETLVGGEAPRRVPSTGRVYVDNGAGGYNAYYPSVFDCFWRPMKPREILANAETPA